MLACVTIVLAVLAILVGALAVWGYQSIKTEAKGVATRAVEKAVNDAVLKNFDESAIKRIIRKEVARVRHESREEEALKEALLYSAAFSTRPSEETGNEGHVGSEYPEK